MNFSGPKSIEADYNGHCPACEQPIWRGDWIFPGVDGWAHTNCPSDRTLTTPVCVTCFQHKAANGACACEVGR